MDTEYIYNELDFAFPAQRFNIQYSYISKKGLPFIREFVLRLVHLAPLSKHQVLKYFGMSSSEVDEAISDLVDREELTLSAEGKLILTAKSSSYFTKIGDPPRVSNIQDAVATLSFDLPTFTCVEIPRVRSNWKACLTPEFELGNMSDSEKMAEKSFQLQFEEILDKGYLKSLQPDELTERPAVYTVNGVQKLGQVPFRLKTNFRMGSRGEAVERDDYEQLNNSELMHELVTSELSRLCKANNSVSISKAMMKIGDEETLELFDSSSNVIDPHRLHEMNVNSNGRPTFIGPLYSLENWEAIQQALTPILVSHATDKLQKESGKFIWIAPSDGFWGKSDRFTASFSQFLHRASTADRKIYSPLLYVPISDDADVGAARRWKNEFQHEHEFVHGLVEGFLDGNVEILHLEGQLSVVSYHFSLPEQFPVPVPIGFLTTDKEKVKKIGSLVSEYLGGIESFDKPNDCGLISSIVRSGSR